MGAALSGFVERLQHLLQRKRQPDQQYDEQAEEPQTLLQQHREQEQQDLQKQPGNSHHRNQQLHFQRKTIQELMHDMDLRLRLAPSAKRVESHLEEGRQTIILSSGEKAASLQLHNSFGDLSDEVSD